MMEVDLTSSKSTLEVMNRQRQDGTLCDVKITVDDGHVFAHKAVLGDSSVYFRTMFTGGFRERGSPSSEIDMSEVFHSIAAVELLVQSIYTGEIDLTLDNVCDLHSSYSFLLCEKLQHLCEDFMTKNLSLVTCIDYWQATYYDNPSGKLYSIATQLFRNRMHDHFIYQECLLGVPVATVSGILKANVTEFCSPAQILTFLLKWFLRSEHMDTSTLKQLVVEAKLSDQSDFWHMVDDLHVISNVSGSTRQRIGHICEELFHLTITGEKLVKGDHRSEAMCQADKEHIRSELGEQQEESLLQKTADRKGKHSSEQTYNDGKAMSVSNELNGERRLTGKDLIEKKKDRMLKRTLVKDNDRPSTVRGIRRSTVDIGHARGDKSTEWENDSVIPRHIDSLMDRLSSHMTSDLTEKTKKLDVLLAFSPSLTAIEGENRIYGQLRLCAYVVQCKLWVDIGLADYPVYNPHDGVPAGISDLCCTGRNVCLASDRKLFFLRLPSCQWKRVVLPKDEYGSEKMFPLCLKDAIYVITIHGVSKGKNPFSAIAHTITLGKITDEGIYTEILRHEDKASNHQVSSRQFIMYGPCWAENSHICVLRGWYACDINESNVIHLDPENRKIATVPLSVGEGVSSSSIKMRTKLTMKPHILKHGGWVYGIGGPNIYLREHGDYVLRFRMSNDKSSVLIERHDILFPDLIYARRRRERIYTSKNALPHQFPEPVIFRASGSSFWRFDNVRRAVNSLNMMDMKNPSILEEHTPPPCNVMLKATGTSLDSALLWNKPLSRYLQIHDPCPESNGERHISRMCICTKSV